MFIDMLGAAFHLWFGSFIGMQTMKTRAVFNKVGGHSCEKDCYCMCYDYDITLTILSPLYRKDTFELKTVTNKVLGLEKDKGLKEKEYENYVLGTNNEW